MPKLEKAQGRAKHPGPMFPFKMASSVSTFVVVLRAVMVAGIEAADRDELYLVIMLCGRSLDLETVLFMLRFLRPIA